MPNDTSTITGGVSAASEHAPGAARSHALRDEPGSPDSISPQNGEAKGEEESFGAGCPECGGSLSLYEGQRSIRCPYCRSALLVTRPRGFRSYILRPRITEGKARLEALRYISEMTNGKVRGRHSSVFDLKLINVPFWRMRGMMAGWVSGEIVKRKQVEASAAGPEGSTTRWKTVEERRPFSRLVLKNVEWSTPASPLRHLGLHGIAFKARSMQWETFDHRLRESLHIALPMRSASEAERTGLSYLSGLITPAGAIPGERRFDLLDKDFSIYYYPVYLLRYKHRGIIYPVTIDACDGRVIRGSFPARRRIDLRSVFFIPAAAAFMAGTWAPLIPIAAAALYVRDLFREGAFIAPHHWLFGKLEQWFGGDL